MTGQPRSPTASTVALACAFAAAIAAAPVRGEELPTVPALDVIRYSGVWHEIARLPYKMQERCAADVTTTFSRRGMRSFDVETRCRRADGSEETDVGIARIQDTSTNAKMEIRFLPLALAWWPFAWSDYWVLDVAPDYSHALIGVPARDSMWILARKPDLEPATYQRLVAKARALGFDVDKLIRTKQTGS